MKMKDLGSMPADEAALIVRMHHRMQHWRTLNPKKTVTIFWRDTGWKVEDGKTNDAIIQAPIRTAISIGLLHVNDCGFDMLVDMCAPEALEPMAHHVKQAIELDV